MNKIISLIGAATVLTAPSLFAAYDGTLNFVGSTHQSGSGGEFNVVATGLGSFATFCIEESQTIGQPPSGPYSYFINSGAVTGGGNSGIVHTDSHTGATMDNISIGTAWLYSQFRAHTLTLDTGSGSYFDANAAVQTTHAGELQNAIWFLEDEGGANNGYVALAESVLSKTLAQIQADSSGAYGVVALNLYVDVNNNGVWDAGDTMAQDQLAIVPEASTVIAGALLLLPLGASALRILRRNRCVAQT